MNRSIFLCCCLVLFFCSCIERSYFVNPGYGNSMHYHTLPLKKDSVKSSLYFNASILSGNANYNLRDEQYAVNVNIYNANVFSMFKAWYGGGLTLGDYVVKRYDSASRFAAINNIAGGKFYGSLNANGGIAFTVPLGASEWRILGVQASLQQEFGNFLSFRKKIAKDSIPVDGNTTNAFLPTIGVSTEFSFKLKNGAFNFLMQCNWLIGKDYKYFDYDDTDPNGFPKLYRYGFFTTAFAFTDKKITAYLQMNAGTRMRNVQTGINYNLSFHKKN